ncbi:hypothetical protein BC829DRAFT_146153 [Chytridium lagenaria]|nr:hypothetical protein BC829DRAFT_146153 [Chytridium lagenaria]
MEISSQPSRATPAPGIPLNRLTSSPPPTDETVDRIPSDLPTNPATSRMSTSQRNPSAARRSTDTNFSTVPRSAGGTGSIVPGMMPRMSESNAPSIHGSPVSSAGNGYGRKKSTMGGTGGSAGSGGGVVTSAQQRKLGEKSGEDGIVACAEAVYV